MPVLKKKLEMKLEEQPVFMHLPGTGIEPIAPVLTDPRCELRYPLGHWRYCYTDYFIT